MTTFIALLHRDLRVVRRELFSFLLRVVLNPLVLAAAQMVGIDEIYRVGGAQAIAALAYGTATIAPVDKIVGPGNAYVAAAKRVLRIASGDTVEVETLLTNSPEGLQRAFVPADQIEQALRDVFKEVTDKGPGGHILTGPIYVEGAEPWVAEAPPSRQIIPAILPGVDHLIEFHGVARGSCWAGIAGEEPIRLHEGDLVLFPQGAHHVISSAPGMRAA